MLKSKLQQKLERLVSMMELGAPEDLILDLAKHIDTWTLVEGNEEINRGLGGPCKLIK